MFSLCRIASSYTAVSMPYAMLHYVRARAKRCLQRNKSMKNAWYAMYFNQKGSEREEGIRFNHAVMDSSFRLVRQ